MALFENCNSLNFTFFFDFVFFSNYLSTIIYCLILINRFDFLIQSKEIAAAIKMGFQLLSARYADYLVFNFVSNNFSSFLSGIIVPKTKEII